MLIDMLSANEASVSKQFLDGIFKLGNLIEMKSVALRDIYKVGSKDLQDHNCFEEWAKVCGKGNDGSVFYDEVSKLEFLKYVDDLTTLTMNTYQEELGTDEIVNRKNLNNYVQQIESYYTKRRE